MLSLDHHLSHNRQQPQLQRPSTSGVDDNVDDDRDDVNFRDIHPLASPPPPPPPPLPLPPRARQRDAWETGSHRSSSLSDVASSENFTTMSREFNALVLAGSAIGDNNSNNTNNENSSYNRNSTNSLHRESGDPHQYGGNNLERIGEEEAPPEESNPLAIVPTELGGVGSSGSRTRGDGELGFGLSSGSGGGDGVGEVSVQRVKKEEVETKISAWQNAKIAKINNRFKREDAVISGWEGEQVQKATSWMKKVERKLEEKRARALEKMQNDVAKARRKAEERRASAEAKRGMKAARVLEIASLMRAVGRAPAKRSFFK